MLTSMRQEYHKTFDIARSLENGMEDSIIQDIASADRHLVGLREKIVRMPGRGICVARRLSEAGNLVNIRFYLDYFRLIDKFSERRNYKSKRQTSAQNWASNPQKIGQTLGGASGVLLERKWKASAQ